MKIKIIIVAGIAMINGLGGAAFAASNENTPCEYLPNSKKPYVVFSVINNTSDGCDYAYYSNVLYFPTLLSWKGTRISGPHPDEAKSKEFTQRVKNMSGDPFPGSITAGSYCSQSEANSLEKLFIKQAKQLNCTIISHIQM